MSKLSRLLNLTATLLDASRPLTAEQLRERVNGYPDNDVAFHRAFERDKESLRELGFPIDIVTAGDTKVPKAAYRLDKRRYSLRDPGLTREELAALQFARAVVMFDGVEPDQPVVTLRKLGGLGGSEETAPPVGSLALPEPLADIFGAISESRLVEFTYTDTERIVEPFDLTFTRGHWYLTGFDRTKDGIRNFRVDRMVLPLSVGDVECFHPDPGQPDLLTSPWQGGNQEPTEVTVAIDREPAQATMAEYPDLTVKEHRADGSVLVSLSVTNREGFFSFMAGLLTRAEVLGPPVIREQYIGWLKDRARTDKGAQDPSDGAPSGHHETDAGGGTDE